MTRSASTDRGSLSFELAILLPVFVLMGSVAIMFGRETLAQTAVDLAAQDAARTASLQRSYAAAVTAATKAATDTLNEHSTSCENLVVDLRPPDPVTHLVPPDPFNVPVGQPATITVRISCDVSIADLAIVPVPHTTVELSSYFSSPLDVYRYRVPTPTPSGSS
jgi:hypothetical protein